MSAEEKLREYREHPSHNDRYLIVALADAAIAALEAESDFYHRNADRVQALREQAEAELAALKARRCEMCCNGEIATDTEEPRVYCCAHSGWWDSDGCCSKWTPREDR